MGCSWKHQGGLVSLKPHPLNCWVQREGAASADFEPFTLCLPGEVQPVLVSP